MKSRESLVRLKEFQLKEKRRQLKQLQMMMGEFERMAKDLENQIQYEEKKSGITDPNHFAYSTFAKAARQRSDNLQVSIRYRDTDCIGDQVSRPARIINRRVAWPMRALVGRGVHKHLISNQPNFVNDGWDIVENIIIPGSDFQLLRADRVNS